MTGKKTETQREALLRLADAMADDVLKVSDAELLAEAAEDGEDPQALAAAMRRHFDQIESETGKARMAAARAALNAQQLRPEAISQLDPANARRRLQQALAQSPETARKLTLAARKGEDLSDDDVLAILEDLADLGILPPHDGKGG